MKKECILFTGLQASGKTTFFNRCFPDYVHVNLDTLHTRNKERILMEQCFAAGTSFVIDNTNPTREDRRKYIEAAKEHEYRVIGYYFQSAISACRERNSRRTGKAQVPFAALASTYKALELPDPDEGFDELHYVRIDEDGFIVEPWKNEEENNHEV